MRVTARLAVQHGAAHYCHKSISNRLSFAAKTILAIHHRETERCSGRTQQPDWGRNKKVRQVPVLLFKHESTPLGKDREALISTYTSFATVNIPFIRVEVPYLSPLSRTCSTTLDTKSVS